MSKVIDLESRRRQKDGKPILLVDHATGKITGHPPRAPAPEFGDRLDRIRASLERINRLMADLKKLGERENDPNRLC